MLSSFKTKTLAVDGNYLIKRSYHGAKHTYGAGRHIGALYGFIIKIRQLIKAYDINKVIVFWDGENGGKLRYDFYKGYKANRESKEWHKGIVLSESEIKKQEEEKESFLWQKVRIQQYLEDLFIRQIEVDQMESDDLIAYYCMKYCDNERIIIYTNDRDLCQLLDYDNVSIYLDNTQLLINKKSYYLLFKHHYKNLKLIKMLCGDASDNIKGIDGLGEKTLLKHFPQLETREVLLEEILSEAENINKIRKKGLVAISNIIEGKFLDFGVLGQEHYKINEKLIDLLNPLLTREAMGEIRIVADSPLDDTNRGSTNLMRMMMEDGFLDVYTLNFIQPNPFKKFCEPFFPVILTEKDFLKKSTYIKQNEN